jgi:hypothetical protein
MLLLVFVGFLSGCDNRPKYVLPSSPVPPARPPVAAGGGGTPANPAADAETREKLSYPKELPAEATPPEKKD